MYEDRSYELILDEMLDAVPSNVDKREGSVIYDALAPAAWKLAEAYMAMAAANNLAHAQTSSGEELRRRGADFGIDPLPATHAVRKGLFFDGQNNPLDVPTGSRYGAGGLVFKAIERTANGVYELRCESAGAAGNLPSGSMLPIDYVDGLGVATLADVVVPGEDEEDDESFRARFFAQVRTPPTSGNRAAYRKWALEVQGVGDAYIEPAWDGANTVKVHVLGSDWQPASGGVVQAVKDYIDPDIGLGEGMGEGQAPAGAVMTAAAAGSVEIDVEATVVLSGSRTISQVKADFETALVSHLADIARTAFSSVSSDRSVKLARIGTLLLDTAGVSDYNADSLLVNGSQANVAVPAGSVAVKGTVTLVG
jgi:uncharacterized phage protein gp47/JayE